MRKILVAAFVVLLDCTPRLACAELLLSDRGGTWTSELKRGLLGDPLDVRWCPRHLETVGRLPACSRASGLPLDSASALKSLALCLPTPENRLSQSLPSLAGTSPNRGFSGPSLVSLLSFSSADPSCCPGLLSDGLLFPQLRRPSTLGRLSGLMNSLTSTEEDPINSGGLGTRFAFPNR